MMSMMGSPLAIQSHLHQNLADELVHFLNALDARVRQSCRRILLFDIIPQAQHDMVVSQNRGAPI